MEGSSRVLAFKHRIQTFVSTYVGHLSSLLPSTHVSRCVYMCVCTLTSSQASFCSHHCCRPVCVSSHLHARPSTDTMAAPCVCDRLFPREALHLSQCVPGRDVTLAVAHHALGVCFTSSCVRNTLLNHFQHCSAVVI